MMKARTSLAVTALLFVASTLAPGAIPELRRAGFLGVQVAPITDEVRARLRLPSDGGALVAAAVPGGSAEAAGLRADDVIVSVGGQPIASPQELIAQLSPRRAGDKLLIEWLRAGEMRSAEMVVKPRPLESGPGTRTEYGAVAVEGHLRRTIVTGPPDEARHPGVLFLTGVGCSSQESLGDLSTVSQLLHGLAHAGFITMRVEKSGVGDSQGPACASPQADLNAEMAGYLQGLKTLKAMPRVDPDRVFILGLSIGGIEAPIIAQREPVRGIAVINTTGKPFFEYLLDTRRRQMKLHDIPYDEQDRRQRLVVSCNFALLLEKKPPDAILASRPECRESTEYPAPYTFMQQWASLDMSSEWKKVNVPVLIVQGQSDYVATIEDAPLLRDIIDSFHPGTATLAPIPGMDHFLTKAASMKESLAGSRGEFEPKVLEAVREWMLREVVARS
jgi:pimeloyl-ACP methyl ester carboxylesterase